MRFALILALAGSSSAMAQNLANPNRIRPLISRLEGGQVEQVLTCEVAPTKPLLNYSFRYQAGYRISVPMKQYSGEGHRWTTVVQITPRGGAKRPVYLTAQYSLPPVPKTNAELQVSGAYQLGEGNYDVHFMLMDNAERICRKNWKVEVRLARPERKVRVGMPPDTVWDLGMRGVRVAPEKDDTAPMRLTVFLHTAPLFPRRTRMRSSDMITLVSTVSSLLERLPASRVRLVLFNLDQQKELFRKDNFLARDVGQVYQSMANIELGLVDYQVLQNRKGHVDLLSELMNREMAETEQSDMVLFLGPASRFFDRMPSDSVERPASTGPQFFYFQIVPGPMMRDAGFTDSIKSALNRVGGKTIMIRNPGEFAKAIERVEKAPRLAPQSATR